MRLPTCLLACVLAGLTCRQAMVWTSDLTLWTHGVAVTPTRPRALVNLGIAHARAQHYRAAITLYDRAAVAIQNPRRTAQQRGVLALIQQNRTTALVLGGQP